MLRASEVASVSWVPRPRGGATHTREPIEVLSRRRFLGRAATVGMALSLAALGVFPPAREAFADGYDVWTSTTTGPCGPGGYAQNHNCSPGCGPSGVCDGTSNGYCCDSTVWHCSSLTDCPDHPANVYFMGLRPNECYQGTYDAWMWKCSSSLKYRCHDGTSCLLHAGCINTICRKSIAT